MHFIKSSLSFVRFRVIGDISFAREDYQKAVWQNSFRDLSELQEDEESVGWVSPENCLEEPLLDYMMAEPYLKLMLRVDRRKISGALLSAHMVIEERAELETSGKEKLSVNRRRELKRSVKQLLLQKTAPSSNLYRALWNFRNRTCLLFTTSKGIQRRFCKIFNETFSLELEPLSPWALAAVWADKNNAIDTLKTAELSLFNKGNTNG